MFDSFTEENIAYVHEYLRYELLLDEQ